ncbi:hypothetical protein WA026_001239 [Henosepilachna vigintioctopunctata]|uniref:Prominin-like protein n=1 Tax=Henosepilachna vigintioctopunctata TaxID=420089 RepID=A0AAW1URF1_9CUCU
MGRTRRNPRCHTLPQISGGSSVNFICFLLTCLVLLLAVGASSGDTRDTFIRHLNKIGKNLGNALNTAMNEPNYTSVHVNVTYESNAVYNPKGLGELYNITKSFMKMILPEAVPRNILTVENNSVRVDARGHVWDLLLQYSVVLVICLVVVLLGASMPVCGVFFCCCRCCGKCGARSRPYDKKHDLCRRIYLATLLIVCGTLLLFGVVCAFVTNERLQSGVQNLPEDVRKSVRDTNKFLNNTNGQVNILLKKNFNEFYGSISLSLDECSDIVFKELEQISNASSMDEIASIARQFPNFRSDYELLKKSTNDLRIYASQLNDAVRRIKKDLLITLQNCNGKMDQCTALNRDISRLQTNVDFDRLPDIQAQLIELDRILANTNVDDILKGEEKLRQIQVDIQNAVKDKTDEAKKKIREAGHTISSNADKISSYINKFRGFLNEVETGRGGDESALDTAQRYIDRYDPYRYYVGLTVCVILLFITTFVVLGLICGICGKRPGGYGDDCCNKGSGSQFLLCGVMFMFFFTSIIAVTALVYLLVGIVAQEAACKSLRDPSDSRLFALVDRFNLSEYGLHGKLSQVISRCHRNETAYVAFDLRRHFDVDRVYGYLDEFDIERALNALDRTTAEINFRDFVLLTPMQLNTLKSISESDFPNVDFNKFLDELSANFTSIDLKVIRQELTAAIRKVREDADNGLRNDELGLKLQSVLEQLDFYEKNVVRPMQEIAQIVRDTATTLDKRLRLGHGSFREGMMDLMQKVKQAQHTLREEGPKLIKEAAADFARDILEECKKYMDRVVNMTKKEIGKCGPVSNAFNATLTTVCDKIALQMNGLWFTLVCSMLVFLPTIVISVKLAILYQKQVPFSDYYVETGRGGKEKRKKGKRREDRTQLTSRTGNAELVPREVASSSTHQDARYSDMAPKNWEEFPAGGPPQYQRAPTEYERPPPYYFPGTTTEQP